jgi:hypothetical protein
MCEFCPPYFNGFVWRWITFQVTFVVNEQIQQLKLRDGRQQITFSAYFDPFNGQKQRKLLFEINLPSSGYTRK